MGCGKDLAYGDPHKGWSPSMEPLLLFITITGLGVLVIGASVSSLGADSSFSSWAKAQKGPLGQ